MEFNTERIKSRKKPKLTTNRPIVVAEEFPTHYEMTKDFKKYIEDLINSSSKTSHTTRTMNLQCPGCCSCLRR